MGVDVERDVYLSCGPPTKAGIRELRSASIEAAKLLDRLKCLAERVLVTKSSWGTPNLEVDELSPLANYFTSDGTAIIRHKSGRLSLQPGCKAFPPTSV